MNVRSSLSAGDGRGLRVVATGLVVGLLVALLVLSLALWRGGQQPLLLAPAIGGLHDCLDLAEAQEPLEAACTGPQASAAERIETQLQALGPRRSADGRLEVGYTLVVPLLNLFRSDDQSADGWTVDGEAVRRIARTVQDVDRPMVLYLFSTHFSEDAPIEPVLAQDTRNLAETPAGPLQVDSFLNAAVYPWSIVRTDNTITQRREEAIAAVTRAICRLPQGARQRIVGINLLGEVHHLYPDFEAGMGHGHDYVITDYSEVSRTGFQQYLRQRFGVIEALNHFLGSDFADFRAVQPPAADIQRDRLDHYWQHIDDAAAGTLAVGGWVHDAARVPGETSWVRIYLDGQWAGRVPAHFSRQDVLQTRPELGTAYLGWRFDLRHANQPVGRHRIDVGLEGVDGRLQHLGTRYVAIMGRDQKPVPDHPMQQPLPPMQPVSSDVAFWVDVPVDGRAVFYNPLVPLWHDFRARQVVAYLEHFDRLLEQDCLADVPRRTQQIYPAEKAGWDANRFAAGLSLQPFGRVQLGINLYGEATNDNSFFDWLASSRQPGYSVTEFHPLLALDAPELVAILERHRRHGARTLSFFLHPVPAGHEPPNPYALDPDNPLHGSDHLYKAMQQVLGS